MPQSVCTTRMPCLVQYRGSMSVPRAGQHGGFHGHACVPGKPERDCNRMSIFFHKFKPLRTRRAGNDVASRGQALFRCCDCAQVSGHARLGMAYHSCIPGMQEGSDTCVD